MSEKQENFTLLDGRVTMKRSIYNPTSDAVWLAAYAPTNIKTVLDIGIGTGGVSLCLLQRNPNLQITGIDISIDMLNSCKTNMNLNNRNIDLIKADIFDWSTSNTFDLVITNPPYFTGTPRTTKAHHTTNITKWIERGSARVKPGGFFCTITDTLVIDTVISVLKSKHFGNIQIFPLFSNKLTAERVLIRAKQGVKTGTRLYSGTNMNNDAILRSGLTIDEYLTNIERQ